MSDSSRRPVDRGRQMPGPRTMPAWASGRRNRPRQRRWRGLPGLVAVLLLFGAAALLAARLDPLPPRFSGTAVASDGDSLRMAGDRIRLLGIDAPEHDQVCWDGADRQWRCGETAWRKLAQLVHARSVVCQPEGVDKYARTLATCDAGGLDLGRAMVSAGLAIASPDYRVEEAAARLGRRGIWQGRFADPRDWRDNGPSGEPEPGPLETLWTWFRELTGARNLR